MKYQGLSLSIIVAGVVLLGINSASSQVTQAWEARYNGPANGIDQAVAVAVDNAGHVYVTGPSTGGVGQDFATVKYDSDGSPSPTWPDVGFGVGVRRYTRSGYTNNVPSALVVDGAGNVYVTGKSGNGGSYTVTTIKYDANGNQGWVALYYKLWNENGIGVTLDDAGNVYVLVDMGFFYTDPTDPGGAHVLKYAPDGTLSTSWPDAGQGVGVRRYSAIGKAFTVSGDGKVSVTGFREEGVAAPNRHIFTWQFDAGGNLAWAARYAGVSSYNWDIPKAITRDDSDHIYVVGQSGPLSGYASCVILKYDSDGSSSATWADSGFGVGVRRYQGPSSIYNDGTSLAVDNTGQVYVTGLSQSTTGAYSFASLKYDAAGNLSDTWPDTGAGVGVRLEPGALKSTNSAPVLVLDPTGNPVVTGLTGSSLGSFKVFAYEGATGVRSWLKVYSGPASGRDEPTGLAMDSEANVYVAGRSTGVDSGDDFATIKYVKNAVPLTNAGSDQTTAVGNDCQASVTLDGTGSSDPDNDALTFTWTGSFGTATGATPTVTLGAGVHTITLTVDDGKGGSASDTVLVTVVDATPPTVIAPPGTAASADASGQALIPSVLSGVGAIDNCTPTGNLNLWQSPLPGTSVGLGTHTITVYASDSAGNQGTATTTFTVNDTTPPIIQSLTASPSTLSATGKLVLVTLSAMVTDNTDPAPRTRIVSVTANEPLKAPGAGVKNPDYQITGDLTLYLRAKSSTKAGRVYAITVESVDVAGNRSTATVNVAVASGGGKGR